MHWKWQEKKGLAQIILKIIFVYCKGKEKNPYKLLILQRHGLAVVETIITICQKKQLKISRGEY